MTFQDYKYGLTKITSIAIDTNNGNYLWLAFAKNSNNVCLLKKVSANNLSQVYYTVSVPVNSINAMVVVNGYIFLAVTPLSSGTYLNVFSWAYSVSNPLTTWNYINNPVGVDESPIGIGVGSTNLYFLTPGIISAEEAKIVSITTSNVYVETINLSQSAILVRNASCITVDASNNLWVGTNTTPSNLIRVWKPSSIWEIEETSLI